MRAFKLFLYLTGIFMIITLGFAVLKYTPVPTGSSNQRPAELSSNNKIQEPKIINSLENKETQEQLKIIATNFIKAEYEGDIDTALALTAKDANQDIKNGDIDFAKSHKFDQIVHYNFIETDNMNYYIVVVAVSASIPSEAIPTTYFENLTIEKINDIWLITKIERDA